MAKPHHELLAQSLNRAKKNSSPSVDHDIKPFAKFILSEMQAMSNLFFNE